jgi:hypothetical protein
VVRALAANARAPLAVEDLRRLCARGRDDAVLARSLLDRGEPTLDVLPLYLAADLARREQLINLVRAAGLNHIGRADDLAPLDDEAVARLEAHALRRKRSSFALVLAKILGCDPLRARKIVEDEGGDALTLAFIAIGLPREIAARVFLVAFPKVALSVEAFERNIALYARLPRREAARIVDAITGEAGKTGATHARARAGRIQRENLRAGALSARESPSTRNAAASRSIPRR